MNQEIAIPELESSTALVTRATANGVAASLWRSTALGLQAEVGPHLFEGGLDVPAVHVLGRHVFG